MLKKWLRTFWATKASRGRLGAPRGYQGRWPRRCRISRHFGSFTHHFGSCSGHFEQLSTILAAVSHHQQQLPCQAEAQLSPLAAAPIIAATLVQLTYSSFHDLIWLSAPAVTTSRTPSSLSGKQGTDGFFVGTLRGTNTCRNSNFKWPQLCHDLHWQPTPSATTSRTQTSKRSTSKRSTQTTA